MEYLKLMAVIENSHKKLHEEKNRIEKQRIQANEDSFFAAPDKPANFKNELSLRLKERQQQNLKIKSKNQQNGVEDKVFNYFFFCYLTVF